MSLPGRLVELPVGRVFVHQGGREDAPPLVLVHGMYVSHYYWKPVIEALEERFRVTALDLPGFGESDRPPVEKFGYSPEAQADVVADTMSALGIERALVVGHSMGGGVVTALAGRHPGRVRRLVVENGWVYKIVMPTLNKILLVPGLGGFVFKNILGRHDLARHFRSVFKDPAVATAEMIDYYWERLNRAGGRAAGHAALTAFGKLTDEETSPTAIRAPTLVVWGEGDPLFPLAHGRRLAGAITGATLATVPDVAHSPHEERPGEWLRVVVPFLEADAAAARG